jgi:hypothetical protein
MVHGPHRKTLTKKTHVGFLVGAEAEYYTNEWLGIAAGLNYAQQGWEFEGGGSTVTTKLDYLNIPVTANFYVAQGLALKAGVQLGFLLSAKQESINVKDAYIRSRGVKTKCDSNEKESIMDAGCHLYLRPHGDLVL